MNGHVGRRFRQSYIFGAILVSHPIYFLCQVSNLSCFEQLDPSPGRWVVQTTVNIFEWNN
jgi:hypothetical protein